MAIGPANPEPIRVRHDLLHCNTTKRAGIATTSRGRNGIAAGQMLARTCTAVSQFFDSLGSRHRHPPCRLTGWSAALSERRVAENGEPGQDDLDIEGIFEAIVRESRPWKRTFGKRYHVGCFALSLRRSDGLEPIPKATVHSFPCPVVLPPVRMVVIGGRQSVRFQVIVRHKRTLVHGYCHGSQAPVADVQRGSRRPRSGRSVPRQFAI